ncbi:xanthine dehydrogenase family protein molybdopterin-binding subunit [Portibacter lacus]|uniref:Isoquinoline 1-oxidoreductase subunit beta n=1 Tax=Portibacter lacus TaxID=1099794 RepID=A0AA37SMQ0_9BACT|nr:molybdopterin cofactor-binding domain-containing protein [Portibacter lacus]GLR15681.1 isoquinoline 1-oxidoreductase subunit beta [Portibacter lacus]
MNVKVNRRSFIQVSSLVSGGLVLGFSWGSCTRPEEVIVMPKEWFDLNGFLKIGDNGLVTIMSPNPEIGQNVKTAMPMIIAEELDVDWKNVIVEQAPLNTDLFNRQVAGGSQSIRQGWTSLRTTGATAKQMLINAAAQKWEVEASTLKAEKGFVINSAGEKLGYGELASIASGMEVPTSESVKLKDPKDFTLIGTNVSNVDIDKIITGKPLFGIDTKKEGMVYASVLRPPSFGNSLKSVNDAEARQVTGVSDVVQFGDKVAVIASNSWAAMKGKKALKAEWENGETEDTAFHDEEMMTLLNTKTDKPKREEGNVEKGFAEADEVIERIYEAPFLPHNCLEPMNFYADVRSDKVELLGPIQTPAGTRKQVADLLERPEDEVSVDMTRMGGGFGRRLYGDFALEAAEISDKIKKPVQVLFTREDDMTAGTYRPASKYKFKAGIKDGRMTSYHLVGVGYDMWGNCTRHDNFPGGAVDNYLVESHTPHTNITTGAWRAPITNFLAFAEQAFLDEVAEKCEKDPVEFRLELFEKAKSNPAGKVEYDVDKSIGVIKLAAEKSNWGKSQDGVYQGFSTYYSHNTYVAEVAEVVLENGSPKVQKVTCAIDCGIVVNPLGALNQVEGGVVDGIGHAMYADFSFENGRANHENFNTFRLIRNPEAPKVETHFVESYNDPTGLGEPTLPPAGGAIANAFAKAGKERMYKQPFIQAKGLIG